MKTRMSRGGRLLAGMPGQQTGRPQLLGVAQFGGLATRQRDQPGARLGGDRWRTPRALQIVERGQRPELQRLVEAALHLRPIGPQRSRDGRDGGARRIGQQDARAFHALRRRGPRPADRLQLRRYLRAQVEGRATTPERHGDSSPKGRPEDTRCDVAMSIWNRSTSARSFSFRAKAAASGSRIKSRASWRST